MGELTATVVGGGIAGLACAAGLLQADWRVTVLERAPAFGEVGAGVAVTRNGMAGLDALGVGDAVRAAGWPVRSAGFQDRRGRWLLRLPDLPARQEPSVWLRAVHRQELHAALLNAAAGARLLTGATATAVDPGAPGGPRARVTYHAGDSECQLESDVVVLADGLRSTARAALFPGTRPRYGGATSWRAVVEDTARVDDRFIAAWGPGAEFGALRISPGRVYWYGYVRRHEGAVFDDELRAARAVFAGWPPWVAATLAATTPDQLMRHDVYHLRGGLPAYTRGRVVMAGDAAHAMLPTAGQGVSTAVEDAVCVASLIAAPVRGGGDLASALVAYDRNRRPRCRRIARQAAAVARFGAHVPGGWRQQARDEVLRLIPGRAVIQAGRSILDWTPPASPLRATPEAGA